MKNKSTTLQGVLLTLIFPFWFLFSKTWIGNILMIPICLLPIPLLIYSIFPHLMVIEGVENVVGILILLCCPFIIHSLIITSDRLEDYYNETFKNK